MDDLKGAEYTVESIKKKETQRRPSAPFITSTLQQEASRKLDYGGRKAMMIAQQLYEGVDLGAEGSTGLITYMRTNSVNVASVAQQEAREVIAARYGKQYVPASPPKYTTKASSRPGSARGDPPHIVRTRP